MMFFDGCEDRLAHAGMVPSFVRCRRIWCLLHEDKREVIFEVEDHSKTSIALKLASASNRKTCKKRSLVRREAAAVQRTLTEHSLLASDCVHAGNACVDTSLIFAKDALAHIAVDSIGTDDHVALEDGAVLECYRCWSKRR